MLPRVGPSLFSVEGVTNVPIVAGGTLARVGFRFPRDLFITGLKLLPQSGAPADAAALTLEIEDETFQSVVSDGQGVALNVPSLAMLGGPLPGAGANQAGGHWFALQRPIRKGDLWFFTVKNTSAGTIVPQLYLFLEEAYDEVAS